MRSKARFEYDQRRREALKKWFREEFLPMLSCKECGENHPACLDFHHVDPSEKEAGVARLLHDTRSKNRLLKEIAKCEVLCANCHRKHHYDQKI